MTLIQKVGGLPVLAHPTTINEREAMVSRLKPAGLVGLEVYYDDYSEDERRRLAGWPTSTVLLPPAAVITTAWMTLPRLCSAKLTCPKRRPKHSLP